MEAEFESVLATLIKSNLLKIQAQDREILVVGIAGAMRYADLVKAVEKRKVEAAEPTAFWKA